MVGGAGPQQILRSSPLIPGARGLAKLVAELDGVGILGLPAHQARPVGEQRLVNDLYAPRRFFVRFTNLVGREQSRVDQFTKNLLGRFALRVAEYRYQLIPLADGAGPLRGDEVAEEFAHDRQPFDTDLLEGRLGMPGQRTANAADVVICLAGQEAVFAVTFLPQPRHGEGEQRQRAALTLDLSQHLIDQIVILEAVAAFCGWLNQGSAKRCAGGRPEQGQIGDQRVQRFVLVTVEEEVVAHGEQDKDIGLEHQTPEKLGKTRLHLGCVQRKQLFELVDDQQRPRVSAAPAGHGGHRGVEVLNVDQLAHRLGVTRKLGSELLSE